MLILQHEYGIQIIFPVTKNYFLSSLIAEEWDREVAETGWQRRWEVAFSGSFERADNEVSTAVAPDTVGSTAAVVVLSGCQIITSNCGRAHENLKGGREGHKLERCKGLWSSCNVESYRRLPSRPGPMGMSVLILASDGLWDVMTNEEAGEVARRLLRRQRRRSLMADDVVSPAQAVADSPTEIAIGRNSSDNVSVIRSLRIRRPVFMHRCRRVDPDQHHEWIELSDEPSGHMQALIEFDPLPDYTHSE
ncbi:Phosphatase 2C family protein isoform 2 [Hibiscus syriacus]|uniref:Phosphatase 2C family protein isoform 2 n=1 Tax=Hibiscus syriacus TaxID=106335 RepID=A0A6A2Y6V3_HIBSY|nr:Phosphatase 2C family protein isoform 2 [Hibiscus syriacus]